MVVVVVVVVDDDDVVVCCWCVLFFLVFSCHALLVLSLRSLSSRRGDVPCTWWVGWMPATLNWNGTCVEKSLMPAELKFCEDGHFFRPSWNLYGAAAELQSGMVAYVQCAEFFFLLFHDIPWATHDCKWPYKPTSFGKWVILQAIRPYAQAHGSWNRVPDLLKTNLEQLQCHLQRHFRNRVPDLFFETVWSSYRCRNSRDGNQGLKWGPTFNSHANWEDKNFVILVAMVIRWLGLLTADMICRISHWVEASVAEVSSVSRPFFLSLPWSEIWQQWVLLLRFCCLLLLLILKVKMKQN